VLGQPGELRVPADASKDLGIPRSDHAATLALERTGNDRRATSSDTGIHDLIDEVNEIVRKTYSYLLAHPNTVANRYQD
jgi:hypothetical protein